MKNKLILVMGLLFLQVGCWGSEVGSDDSDTESASSKSSNETFVTDRSHQSAHEGSSSSSSETSSSDSSSSETSSIDSSSNDSSDSDSSDSDDSDDSGTVQDKVIDKTWGLKNLLQATPDQDLQRSPLMGLIAVGNGTVKKWYGEFTDVPSERQEAGQPARNKRNFATETSLEKVTRAFFDVLDGRVRCSAAGSNPMIALSPAMIGELVILTQGRGISGVSAFLEKGLVRKQKQKKESLQQVRQQISAEELFINQWWARYTTRPEKRKFTEERDFRKRLMPLFKDLRSLELEQGAEKTKHIFLTVLMAFLVLKDETEGQKDPVYAVQEYFKKLGVVFARDYYTTVEKKAIKKRLSGRSFGTSVKDLEDVVFYLTSIAKNDFEFISDSSVSMLFKEMVRGEESNVAHALCAEVAVHSFINLMLYNPITQRFDSAMLPEGIHLDLLVYDFYFNPEHPRTDPQAPRYYAESADAWIQVIQQLHRKFPEIKYEGHELHSSPEDMLLVFNKIFGIHAQSYGELGNLLSKDGSQVTLEAQESEREPKGREWTVIVERDGLPGESPYEFFATLEVSNSHATFIFSMENIMPLMGKYRYQAIEELQRVYHVDLWSMVLTPAAINAVIDDETPFKKAIETGYVSLVELLVAHGADIHQVDDDGMGVLAYAYKSGSSEMVKFFTDKGLELHVDLNTIYTWLWYMEDSDDALFDKIMASNVTDTGQRRKDFYSIALMTCLDKNRIVWAKKLIAEGADVNFVQVIPDSPEEHLHLDAPIIAAARECTDDAFVNELIDLLEPAGDDKNRAMVYGEALMMFLDKDNIRAAEALIQKGADVSFYIETSNDANFAFPSDVYGVVRSASYRDDKSLMRTIVDALHPAGENKALTHLYGDALAKVIARQWFSLARELIHKGADVNFYMEYPHDDPAVPSDVYGVVFEASRYDDQVLMQMIVDRLVHAVNEVIAHLYGKALRNVIYKNWFDIAKILIQKGADVNLYGKDAYPSTEIYGVVLPASSRDDQELMQMIVERLHPAPDEAIARMYGKALFNTIYKDWSEIAAQLIAKGASLDGLDKIQLEYVVSRSKDDQAADNLLQVIGSAKKSDAWAQMYRETLQEDASLFRKTEEWLKRYGAAVEQEGQEFVQAVEHDADDVAQRVRALFGITQKTQASTSTVVSGLDDVD